MKPYLVSALMNEGEGWICHVIIFTRIVSNGVQIVSYFHKLMYIQLRQRIIIGSLSVRLDRANVMISIVSPFAVHT